MTLRPFLQFYLASGCLFFMSHTGSVAQNDTAAVLDQSVPTEQGLFDSPKILRISLSGNLRPLLNNRDAEPKIYPLELSYTKTDSSICSIPVEVRTRGHFRRLRGNCDYPPLMILFPEEGPHRSTIFREQQKLKLVMPCAEDKYIIQEWLVYQLYNLLTPSSFRARLVEVTLLDDKRKKPGKPFYGFLLEEEDQMARRNGMVAVERALKPQQTRREDFLTMAVFEYMIGNTDWSVQYQQNIKLIAGDSSSVAIPVPYDFDHSGIVNAPYAAPAVELQMNSIRQRRFRGYCIQDMQVFDPVVAKFNLLKKDIYGTYTGCSLLDAKYIKSTINYLDAFYAVINDPKSLKSEFSYPCDLKGTGNVVIKGLKKQ
ncbi:MAG: hypothetical protein IT262_20020 [Saprospiraceae bacterium]|nr:hypothetical protein [Saprospiraceae bacterium]